MTAPNDEELTELVDARFDRVDLVGKAANGYSFLVAKGAADGGALFTDEDVRALVAKAGDTDSPQMEDSMTQPTGEAVVAKADDDLDASTVLATPEANASGAETMPGSPAWEELDAATARKWTGILGRAKNALAVLAEREGLEAASSGGDGDDAENAWNLQDAACAVDYAISVLAPFAVGEQIEADVAGDMVDAVSKAAAGLDTDGLELIEALAPVMKAGRVLSASNEAAIRGAVESLQQVLSSLPEAPIAKEAADEPAGNGSQSDDAEGESLGEDEVEKSSIDAEAIAARVVDAVLKGHKVTISAPDAVVDVHEPAAVVAKADDLSGVSLADLKRQALTGSGSEQKAALQELGLRLLTGDEGAPAEGTATDDAAGDADDSPAGDGTEGTAPDGTQAATETDLQTQAPDDAGTKSSDADQTTTATQAADDDVQKAHETVAKAELAEIVKAALQGPLAEINALRDEIAKLRAPVPPRVLANGVLPGAHMLRGQNKTEGADVDVQKAAQLREEYNRADSTQERERIANEMNAQASAALIALHNR